jgi:type III restriction enzyme
VKLKDGRLIVVETKGLEDLDVPLKMARLKQWCEDVAKVEGGQDVGFAYVDQEGFEKHTPATFAQLLNGFTEYQ